MYFKLPKNKSIRKTILNVVIIYLVTTILLVLSISFIYIKYQKEQFFISQSRQSDTKAKYMLEQLEILHDNIVDEIAIYPREGIDSAIYDIDKNLIFSTFDKNISLENKKYFTKDNFIYFVYKIEPYYLGGAYLIVQQKVDYIINRTYIKLIVIIAFIILFLVFTSFLIAKILIKPLSDNFNKLDNFIKDTTHELNTPISAILNNIEMLQLDKIDKQNIKKINRIKIAATTISTIYDDLSFLLLYNKQQSNNVKLNISSILKDRIEYFKTIADSKNISFKIEIEDEVYKIIDKLKLERLFDNLISNAIKYSYINSTIFIALDKNSFVIKDRGIGMNESEIKNIFIKYKRFGNKVGGFGIGYSIIYSIVKEYNISIDIKSQKNKKTEVKLIWQEY